MKISRRPSSMAQMQTHLDSVLMSLKPVATSPRPGPRLFRLAAMAEKAGLDGEGSLMDKLTGDDGMLGKVTGFLDRDGDGNPINDITNMAKGFFKK